MTFLRVQRSAPINKLFLCLPFLFPQSSLSLSIFLIYPITARENWMSSMYETKQKVFKNTKAPEIKTDEKAL